MEVGREGLGFGENLFFFVPSIVAISAAAPVSWSLCQSFLQPPHPSFQQEEVLAPAHFVVPL